MEDQQLLLELAAQLRNETSQVRRDELTSSMLNVVRGLETTPPNPDFAVNSEQAIGAVAPQTPVVSDPLVPVGPPDVRSVGQALQSEQGQIPTRGQIAQALTQQQPSPTSGGNGLPPGVSVFRPPTRDLFAEAGLGNGRQFANSLIAAREQQISELNQRIADINARRAGIEAGDIQVAQSELPELFRVARSPEEFAQFRDEGFLPIMAQDAEAIRRLGAQQANRIRQGAADNLQFAQGQRRNAIIQQIGAGIGTGIGSAIAGQNIDRGGELSTLSQLVNQTREELGAAVRGRSAANVQAGEFDTRSQIDAMLAETDAFRQVQNLLVQNARDTELRRFDEIDRLQQQAIAQQNALDNIRGNEAVFARNLAEVQRLSQFPVDVQLVTDPSARARGSSQDIVRVNQVVQGRLVNAIGKFQEHLNTLKENKLGGIPDDLSNQAAAQLIGEIDTVLNSLGDPRMDAMLLPETLQLIDQARQVSQEAAGAVSSGGPGSQNIFSGIFRDDTEDILKDQVLDDNSLLNRNINDILSKTAGNLGAQTTATNRTAGTVSKVQQGASIFSRGSN